jgi:RNA polymerase sigma-70 factor (ECF subfamily)
MKWGIIKAVMIGEIFEQKTDEEIVEIVPQDKEAFAVLIRRYDKRLFAYIRRITGQSQDGLEDIVQNIFIKAYVNLYSCRKGRKFSSWIYGIAHNEAIDYWRKNKKHLNQASLDDEDKNLLETLRSEIDHMEEILTEEKRMEFEKIINELPAKYKEVLFLKYVENRSYEEISEILRKPVSSVGTLIRRAKQLFKLKVEKFTLLNNFKF